MEYLLLILYYFLFIFIIKKWSFFRNSGISEKSLQIFFVIKVGLGIFLYQTYTYTYPDRSEADIFKYFDDSKIVYESLETSTSDFLQLISGYDIDNEYFFEKYYLKMNNWDRAYDSNLYNDSHTIIRLNALIRLISFGHYLVHMLIFSFLGLLGITAIYRAISSFFEGKKGFLALGLFLIPSLTLWTSGVLKESILILSIGLVIYALHLLLNKDFSFKNWLVLVISLLFLSMMKFYVVLAFLPSIVGYLITRLTSIKPWISHSALVIIGGVAVLNLHHFTSFNFLEIIAQKQADFIRLAQYEHSGSVFPLTPIEPNFTSVLTVIPEGILNCFIRPLPWDSKSLLYLPAILENIFFLSITLAGIIGLVRLHFKKLTASQKSLWYFCICFTLLLFAIIGSTTPVAGALVRYKIPALPFLFSAMLLVINFKKLSAKSSIIKKLEHSI